MEKKKFVYLFCSSVVVFNSCNRKSDLSYGMKNPIEYLIKRNLRSSDNANNDTNGIIKKMKAITSVSNQPNNYSERVELVISQMKNALSEQKECCICLDKYYYGNNLASYIKNRKRLRHYSGILEALYSMPFFFTKYKSKEELEMMLNKDFCLLLISDIQHNMIRDFKGAMGVELSIKVNNLEFLFAICYQFDIDPFIFSSEFNPLRFSFGETEFKYFNVLLKHFLSNTFLEKLENANRFINGMHEDTVDAEALKLLIVLKEKSNQLESSKENSSKVKSSKPGFLVKLINTRNSSDVSEAFMKSPVSIIGYPKSIKKNFATEEKERKTYNLSIIDPYSESKLKQLKPNCLKREQSVNGFKSEENIEKAKNDNESYRELLTGVRVKREQPVDGFKHEEDIKKEIKKEENSNSIIGSFEIDKEIIPTIPKLTMDKGKKEVQTQKKSYKIPRIIRDRSKEFKHDGAYTVRTKFALWGFSKKHTRFIGLVNKYKEYESDINYRNIFSSSLIQVKECNNIEFHGYTEKLQERNIRSYYIEEVTDFKHDRKKRRSKPVMIELPEEKFCKVFFFSGQKEFKYCRLLKEKNAQLTISIRFLTLLEFPNILEAQLFVKNFEDFEKK